MTWSTAFFILFVLACPLMMFWMMRGGHGHGGHGHAPHSHGDHNGHMDVGTQRASTDDLRRQRDELDRLIEEREQEESDRELTTTEWRR